MSRCAIAVASWHVGDEVHLDNPFPIENFPWRVRDSILMEFNGRCPSIREVASTADTRWLQLPGIGPATLAEIRLVIESGPHKTKTRTFAAWTDADLITECDRLQERLINLRNELFSRRQKLAAIKAEMRRRGLSLQAKSLPNGNGHDAMEPESDFP